MYSDCMGQFQKINIKKEYKLFTANQCELVSVKKDKLYRIKKE